MLWWALAGVPDDDGPVTKTGLALCDYLRALGADVRALMAATRGAHRGEIGDLSGALENLWRRMELAADIAKRQDDLRDDEADFGAAGVPDRYIVRSETFGMVPRK